MTDYAAQQRLIAALRNARCYPHPAGAIRVIETHISWILLAGRYAYKVKKAVNLEFLDFTTLDARRFFCLEEIRLNRRMAPQIYLEVVTIGGTVDHPHFADARERARPAVEYAVKMRRFPATRLMDRLLLQGRITAQQIDHLAIRIADFHCHLPPAPPGSAFGSRSAIHAAVEESLAHLGALAAEAHDAELLDAVRVASAAEYAACEEHFDERRNLGHVRECHGDLHLGNVVLIGNDLVPFDGIEFSSDLRWIDVMSEIAFLTMDLLHRGRPDFAFRLLNAYLERTGDYEGVAVLRFYLGYRAIVRAMVSAIRASQPGQSAAAQAEERVSCHSYLVLAKQSLTERHPALLITHGLPGSGKSTFAQLAVEKLQGIRLRSDVERKRLHGLTALQRSRSGAGTGMYSAEATQRTYARLLHLAKTLLHAGYPVVVDAAFLKHAERLQFRELAATMAVPFVIASIEVPPAALRARIAQRHAEQRDASEADLQVLDLLEAAQEPLRDEELACSAVFSNDSDSDLAQPKAWSRLSALLGSSFQG